MVRFLKRILTFQVVPSLNKAFFQHNGMIVRAFVAGAKEDDIELLERVCVCERERERLRARVRQRQEWCSLLLVELLRVEICGQRNKLCVLVAENLADIWNILKAILDIVGHGNSKTRKENFP